MTLFLKQTEKGWCCVFPVLLANLFTPMLIAASYAGHTKTVIIRCISETVSLYATPYFGDLKKSYMFRLCKKTIIRPCISQVQNFVLLQYEPDDGILCASEI
jgi:hypothetical protein